MKPNHKKKDRQPVDKKLYAPVSGTIMTLSDVSDPVYAHKLYGDGIAIAPNADLVVSPCSGSLTMLAYTKHCLGIETDQGDRILIHLGFGTSAWRGKGFEVLAQEGSRVRPGTPLIRFDRKFFENQNADDTVCMILTNQKRGAFRDLDASAVQAGKTPVMEKR